MCTQRKETVTEEPTLTYQYTRQVTCDTITKRGLWVLGWHLSGLSTAPAFGASLSTPPDTPTLKHCCTAPARSTPSPLMWLWMQPKTRRSSVSRDPNTLREHAHRRRSSWSREQTDNGSFWSKLNGQIWDSNHTLHPSNIHSQIERQVF